MDQNENITQILGEQQNVSQAENMVEMDLCQEAVYSEDYTGLLIDYGGDISVAIERYNPVCVQIISTRLAILFLEAPNETNIDLDLFTYRSIPKCFGLLDTSVLEETGVLRLRRQPFIDLYGNGVIIGFIDTGIDYTHPAFVNEDGTTRIESIWDQTIRTGPAPEGLYYGTVYSRDQIDEALRNPDPFSVVPTRDEDGHGTFMAGVAAGNQIESDDFSGIAPNARIVAVKLKQAKAKQRRFFGVGDEVPCFSENDILTGIRYIVQEARRLNLPVVIYLGVGTNSGNHNGNSPLGQTIDYFGTLLGVVFVCGSGNEANRGHHYQSQPLLGDDIEEVEINVGPNESAFSLEIWASTPNLFSVGIVSPGGQIIDQIQPRLGKSETINLRLERTEITVVYNLLEIGSGDELIFIRFETPSPGVWKVQVKNTNQNQGIFNIWLPMERFITPETYFLKAEPNITICEPGNADVPVTVANYNNRTGSIYINSSRGYTKNGRVQPIVAAPGVDVFGPRVRGGYGTMTGASVSAAVTAGLSALILEWGVTNGNDRAINSKKMQNYFIIGANRKDILYPNREWGFGEINVYQTIERIANT